MSARRICSSSGREGDGLGGRRRIAVRGRAQLERLDLRGRLARALELAPADVAQPAADGVRRLDVHHEQMLLEPRRPRDDLACVVEDDRVPVEDELVLSADEVAEREERARVARAGHEHLLALLRLADVERGRGQVHEELRSRQSEVGCGGSRLPDVLADRRADERVAEAQHQEVAALGEVAMLVEDAVVREELLPVDAADLPVRAHRARVRQVAVEPRRPDEGHEAAGGGRRLLERLASGVQEPGAEQQVLGRVPGDRELGEEDEVGAGPPRVAERVHDLVPVAVEVADDDVQLRERQPHVAPGPHGFRLIGEN